jgi:hypothetical protein
LERRGVGNVRQRVADAGDDVERFGIPSERRTETAESSLDEREAGDLGEGFAGDSEHLGRRVDADDGEAEPGEVSGVVAGSAAEIEDAMSAGLPKDALKKGRLSSQSAGPLDHEVVALAEIVVERDHRLPPIGYPPIIGGSPAIQTVKVSKTLTV